METKGFKRKRERESERIQELVKLGPGNDAMYIRSFERIWHIVVAVAILEFWLNSLEFDLDSLCFFLFLPLFRILYYYLVSLIHLHLCHGNTRAHAHTAFTFNIVFRYLSYGYAASSIGQLIVSQAAFAYVQYTLYSVHTGHTNIHRHTQCVCVCLIQISFDIRI